MYIYVGIFPEQIYTYNDVYAYEVHIKPCTCTNISTIWLYHYTGSYVTYMMLSEM